MRQLKLKNKIFVVINAKEEADLYMWRVAARRLRLRRAALCLHGALELHNLQVAAEAGGLLWSVVVRHEGRRDSSGT